MNDTTWVSQHQLPVQDSVTDTLQMLAGKPLKMLGENAWPDLGHIYWRPFQRAKKTNGTSYRRWSQPVLKLFHSNIQTLLLYHCSDGPRSCHQPTCCSTALPETSGPGAGASCPVSSTPSTAETPPGGCRGSRPSCPHTGAAGTHPPRTASNPAPGEPSALHPPTAARPRLPARPRSSAGFSTGELPLPGPVRVHQPCLGHTVTAAAPPPAHAPPRGAASCGRPSGASAAGSPWRRTRPPWCRSPPPASPPPTAPPPAAPSRHLRLHRLRRHRNGASWTSSYLGAEREL